MNKLELLTNQYHSNQIDWQSYKLQVAAAVTELTESDCAELAMALEGWSIAKDVN